MKEWLEKEWTNYISGVVILIIAIIIGSVFNRFMKRYIKKSTTDLDNDPTNYQFLRRAITVIIYTIGLSFAIFSIPSLRALAQSLLAGAGIMAVAIGFASQAALSNIIAGIFIIIFKPFRVHDRVVVKEVAGVIEDITLRHTIIRNFENRRVVIPNSIISDEVIVNSDLIDSKICKWVEIGISYDSDVEKAKFILAEEVRAHPLYLDNRTPEDIEKGIPDVMVRVIGLGDFSVNLRAWAWTNDTAEGFELSCDVLESVKKRFDENDIEIPFPYRTIVHKNPAP